MTIFHIYLLHLNNSLLWWHTAKSFFPPMKRKGLFKLKKAKQTKTKCLPRCGYMNYILYMGLSFQAYMSSYI